MRGKVYCVCVLNEAECLLCLCFECGGEFTVIVFWMRGKVYYVCVLNEGESLLCLCFE